MRKACVCVNEECKALFVYVTGILATALLVCVYCNNGVCMHICIYFLPMAETAFLAASSRSMAEVMGSPLSDRIRFAS